MKYLSLADLMAAGAFALDAPVEVRDWGLLESALRVDVPEIAASLRRWGA